MTAKNKPDDAARTGADASGEIGASVNTAMQIEVDPAQTFVYIGPTKIRTRLIENEVFKGSLALVEKYLTCELETYPEARRLIVPVEELAGAREKIKSPGNLLSKTYADLVSASSK